MAIPYVAPVTVAVLTYYFGLDDGLYNQPTQNRLNPPYTNSDAARVAFTALFNNLVVETWESYPDFTATPVTMTGFTTLGNVVISGINAGFESVIRGSSAALMGVGRYAAYGPAGATVPTSLWQFVNATDPFKLTFDTPAIALGFYGIDLGDWDATLSLKFYFTDATTQNLVVPAPIAGVAGGGLAPYNGSVLFMGVKSATSFTRVDFIMTQGAGFDIFGFDQFFAAAASQVIAPPTPTARRRTGRYPPEIDVRMESRVVHFFGIPTSIRVPIGRYRWSAWDKARGPKRDGT